MDTRRVNLLNAAGRPVLSYLPGTREGRPWADNAALLAPAGQATAEVMNQLRGWLVSASPGFGRELIAHGAQLHRHAFEMSAGLAPGRTEPAAPAGFRFEPVTRSAQEIQPAVDGAFPAGHPDHRPADPDAGVPPPGETELEQLLAGTLVGPLMPCSLLMIDASERVAAGCLVNHFTTTAWITLIFRDPDASPPGTGSLLLHAVLARAARAGVGQIGLAVTATNPAHRVYLRAGFTVTGEAFTVLIPS